MKETPLASNIFDFLYNDVTLKARTDIIESQAYETFVYPSSKIAKRLNGLR